MYQSRRQVVAMVCAVAVTTIAVIPAFMTGAVGPLLVHDLGVSVGFIGLSVGLFFLVSGAVSSWVGRLVQSLGGRSGLVLASSATTLSLLVLLAAQDAITFVLGTSLGGLGNALSHMGANATLAEAIPGGRTGIAVALKQSAIPAATFGSGLVVPLVVVEHGWRSAYAIALAMSVTLSVILVVAAVAPRLSSRGGRQGHGQRHVVATNRAAPARPDSDLRLITVAGAFAGGTAAVLGAYTVTSGIHVGLSPSQAGYVLSFASIVGLLVRLLLGLVADRVGPLVALKVMAWMLVVGAAGMLVVARGDAATFALVMVVAYVAGWGWAGLLHYFAVARDRARAASSTATLQVGLSLGSALGPFAFGLALAHLTYAAAWLMNAGAALLAAVLLGRYLHMVQPLRADSHTERSGHEQG